MAPATGGAAESAFASFLSYGVRNAAARPARRPPWSAAPAARGARPRGRHLQLATIGSDQQALANAARVSADHLCNVLRGRAPCTEDLGRRIAVALGVTVADITRKS